MTRFPTFRPPSRALPTSKELLFAVDFVRVNGTRVFDRLSNLSQSVPKMQGLLVYFVRCVSNMDKTVVSVVSVGKTV